MGQDRMRYRNGVVLIEAARILTPQFNPTTISVSGAQIELLRNLTMYLHNQSMFVDEYHTGYYISATDADYDDISAIVADLEHIIMGNENTVFGYYDRLALKVTHTMTGAGNYDMAIGTVPEGYVYVVNATLSYNHATMCKHRHFLTDSVDYYEIKTYVNQPLAVWAINDNVDYKLKHNDVIRIQFQGCANEDILYGRAWGYIMKLPG